MTDSEHQRLKVTRFLRSRRRLKAWLAMAGAVAIAGGVGGWLGWRRLQQSLPNLVSNELSGALGRPIKLGQLERFSLTGLRFGETILPPTPENFTWARVQKTDIRLNPFDLLLRRTFRPHLLFIRPEVSIKQSFDRNWVLDPLNSVDREGKIITEIGSIRVRSGTISVGPFTRGQIVQAPEGFSSAHLIVLENVNHHLRFFGEQNEQFALNLGSRLKNGTFQIRGEGNLDTREANLVIRGASLNIDTLNPFLGGNLFMGKGYVYANLEMNVRPSQSPSVAITGTARLQNGEALITALPSQFENIYGQLRFNEQQVTVDDTDLKFGPIAIQIQGDVSLQKGFRVNVDVPNMSLEQLKTAFAYSAPVDVAGSLSLTTQVTGPLRSPQFSGKLAHLTPITVDRLGLEQVTANVSGDAKALSLDALSMIPTTGGSITAQGQVDFVENPLATRQRPPPVLNLSSNVDLPLTPLAERYGVNSPIPFGRLTAVAEATGPLLAPIGQINWQLTDGVARGSGQVDYADSQAILTNTRLAIADAGIVTATGQADLVSRLLDVEVDARIALDEIAQQAAIALPPGFTLGTFTTRADATGPLLNPRVEAIWQLRDGNVPAQGRLLYTDAIATLHDTTFAFGDGRLSATGTADLDTGHWHLETLGRGLQLGAVSPQVLGATDLAFRAAGSLANLSPAGMQAEGNLDSSEGFRVSLMGDRHFASGPLAAAFDWDGQILRFPKVTGLGLSASGQLTTRIHPQSGWPVPSHYDFTARLVDFDLAQLNPLLPTTDYGVLLQGRLGFNGTLRGPAADPQLQGDILLREAMIGHFALLSDVTGPIDLSRRQGGSLNLMGAMTKMRAEMGADLWPTDLLFQNGSVLAAAQQQGDSLSGQIRNFPIADLGFRPFSEPDFGVLGGTLNSDFTLQLTELFRNPTATASFTIHRPALGVYRATALNGDLQLVNGRITLRDAFLALPHSQFVVAATANVRSPFSAAVHLTTTDAHIADILTALQIDDLSDLRATFAPPHLGTAADLATAPIITEPQNLPEQLERATAASTLQAEQGAAAAEQLLPPIADLAGTFSADISLAASEVDGLKAAFDVNGQNWHWGQYVAVNQLVARGTLRDQVLTLSPIRLTSGDAWLNLAGQFGREDLVTELQIANFDLAPIAEWLSLPVPIQGQVHALATLSGALNNPTMLGTWVIDNAAANHYPLAIEGEFSYRDAWWRFDTRVQGEPDEPLIVQGQIPYALPFMATLPSSDEMLVRASLGSGGLALLDMFAPYIAWDGGDGNLLIEAQGPIAQPAVQGRIEFQNAQVTSDFLGESLTALNGSMGFESDRLFARELQGSLLGGQFSLRGELPWLDATAQAQPAVTPLTLDLDALAFNFENEIVSQLAGNVVVGQSLQSPVLSGGITLQGVRLNPGQRSFEIADFLLSAPPLSNLLTDIEQRLVTLGLSEGLPTGRFADFHIAIADIAKIQVYPLWQADLMGQVALSGPLVQPTGDGYIELLNSSVNTITTNLFLVTADRRNLITLEPDQGFDPHIDLLYQGELPLQRQLDLPSPNPYGLGNIAEIPELDPLASLTLFDEILIQAELHGFLSDGLALLNLTSTPNYPEDRLLSMISGGNLADLPAAEPLVAASTSLLFALLTEQQEAIGNALGLRHFRFDATTTIPAAEGDLFGVGLGINADITETFAAQLLQLLNRDQPYQLNLRYRLNHEFNFGASTNFSDDSQFFLQYRTSF